MKITTIAAMITAAAMPIQSQGAVFPDSVPAAEESEAESAADSFAELSVLLSAAALDGSSAAEDSSVGSEDSAPETSFAVPV